MRIKVKLKSTNSHSYRTTSKNPKNKPGEKLSKKMYDPVTRKHELFKEEKLK